MSSLVFWSFQLIPLPCLDTKVAARTKRRLDRLSPDLLGRSIAQATASKECSVLMPWILVGCSNVLDVLWRYNHW